MEKVTWQDRLSTEEVAKICDLKKILGSGQKRLQRFVLVRREAEGAMLHRKLKC